MRNILRFTKTFLLFSVFYSLSSGADNSISEKILERSKKAIVTIDSRISISSYQRIGSWKGTGFIADKKNGYIVTNAHVVGLGSIGTYFVTFENGQQAEAKVAYYDLWQDQAILKVSPDVMPKNLDEIKFSKEQVKLNQPVFVVGNNEGQGFSAHQGTLANIYDISGEMPQGSYIVNLNVTSGSSGSPLMNLSGEAIGLHYGGGQTYGIALKGQYVSKILSALQNKTKPSRRHIGIVCELYSLDKGVQHRNFPRKEMDDYIKHYPDSMNKVVAVQYVIPGSPAEKFIKSGDIIWKINNKMVASELFTIDDEMDKSDDSVKLTIYRNGQLIEQDIKTYEIDKHKISKILSFGGATFFETDDHSSAKSGIPLGSLGLVNVQTGSSFSTIPGSFIQDDRSFYRLSPFSFSGNAVSNLDELALRIPHLINQKFIRLDFKNYQPYFQNFNRGLISIQSELSCDITLDSVDNVPKIMKFNEEKMEWESSAI
jgi:S1-C subfamily serine protease